MSSETAVRAGLASIPSRTENLGRVVGSLLPQVDFLEVMLNGYDSEPEFLHDPKIRVHRSQDHGDHGDGGKFFGANQWDGFILTCDDDIIYPPDYAVQMVALAEKYGRRCAVSWHGDVLKKGWKQYRHDVRTFGFSQRVARDEVVHVAGTGVLCYHASTLRISIADFPLPNMADIWFALKARRTRVPLVVGAHQADEAKILRCPSSIWRNSRYGSAARKMSEILSSEPWWPLPDAEDLRIWAASESSGTA